MLFTTLGVQVPENPFFEVVGRTGGGSPSHIDGKEGNVGINMGSLKITPPVYVNVVPPLMNVKLVYKPLFKPVMEIAPVAFATRVIGPMVTPSST